MRRKSTFGALLALLSIGILTFSYVTTLVKAEAKTWTVDDDGMADFETIQKAINAASPEDTIYVYSGTYHEHVTVNKSLTLVGEDKRMTIIDGSLNGTAVKVVADNVRISEFTIRNGSEGISIANSHDNTVSENNITMSKFEGVIIENSRGNTLAGNLVRFNGWDGIYMFNASNTTLQNNTIASNAISGIVMEASRNNTISDNRLDNNSYFGIRLDDSKNVSVVRNTIYVNQRAGISITNLTSSIVYHNNLLDNTEQVRSDNSPNAWDDTIEGNYWSDYDGPDTYSGPSQNETGSDGIGDAPYLVDEINRDKYPLMGPIHVFDAGSWNDVTHHIILVTNSTVSEFQLTRTQRIVSFNITDETDLGFCRLNVPNDIIQGLWNGEYRVTVDGEQPLVVRNWTNEANTYVYFTYPQQTREVIIRTSDTVPPLISIISPENRTYPTEDVPLTFTINEAPSWIGYTIDSQVNITINSNTSIPGLADGTHSLVVYSNDTVGNMGYSNTIHFTVDTLPPDVRIHSPENKTYTTSSVALNFTIDEEPTWIAYCLDGLANETIAEMTDLSDLSDGTHSVIVYAQDIAGNIGASEKILFSIETPSPPPAPFPVAITALILIIAAVGTILLIYVTKVRKTAKKQNGNSIISTDATSRLSV